MVLAISVHGLLSSIASGPEHNNAFRQKEYNGRKWQIAGKKKQTGWCQKQDTLFKGTPPVTYFFSQAHFSIFMIDPSVDNPSSGSVLLKILICQ